jgi:hypothetical protein
MINQELLDYVNLELKNGIPNNQIKNALLVNGWTEEDINNAFEQVAKNQINSGPNNQDIQVNQLGQLNTNQTKKYIVLSKKIILILIILLAIVGVSFAAYKYVYIPKFQDNIYTDKICNTSVSYD